MGRNHLPVWKTLSSMGETISQFGKHFRPWAKTSPILENTFVHGRNHLPFWKTLSSMGETISHFGKRFRPWEKSSPILEDVSIHKKHLKTPLPDQLFGYRILISNHIRQFFIKKIPYVELQGHSNRTFFIQLNQC